jgi:transcription elongation GreA/GreB family factor
LASAAKPAEAVASLEEADLWPAALEALLDRADGAEQLRALLHLAPAGQLDQVARRLTDAGGQQAVEQAAAEALAAPTRHLEVLLWLWQDPSSPPATVPGKVDLLTRLLAALQEIDHDWNILPDRRKALRHRLRAALAQRDCACFRQAVGQMDLAVAGTIKSRIERCVGLAQAVRQDLLAILREDFYTLFAKAQVPPWLDERLLWTTEAALRRRQQALKELLEVKIPQNARDIGAAAEHGDLSENSEWKFALEERDLLQARAAAMQQELALARAIHPEEVAADSVCIGSRVHLERTSDGKRLELAFLGPWDSDVENGVYSYQTPLAAELMGKNVGALAQVRLPGWEGEYRIAALSSAVEQSQ